MAIVTGSLTADEIAWAALDKPLLIGRNWVTNAADADDLLWSDDALATTASTDKTDADAPSPLAGDDKGHLQTFPDSSASTWWIVGDIGALAEVDCIGFINHNLGTVGASIRLDLDDVSNFATAVTALSVAAPSDDTRQFYLSLGAGNARYSGVQFFRIRFSAGGAILPKVGEIILGRRRQLKHQPTDPWGVYDYQSRIDTYETQGGHRTAYTWWEGRRSINPTLNPHETGRIADLNAFFEECRHGSRAFTWIDEPATNPGRAYLMRMPNPRLVAPTVGPLERAYTFQAEELTPFVSSEVSGL